MQLDNLNDAWKQIKFMNSMQHIGSNEILSIIGHSGNVYNSRLQRVLLNAALFISIVIFCQGG